MAETPIILPLPIMGEEGVCQHPLGLAPMLVHTQAMNVDLEQREIYVHSELEEADGPWFVSVLRHLEQRDSQAPIRIMLNTPGGSVDAMFAIHDAIRATPCPVQVLAYGMVCSAGVLLLACGDERLVTPSTVLMSHESRGGQEELGFRASRDRRKFEDWQHTYWAELMGRYTPRDAGWWSRKTERQAEFWLLGGEVIVGEGLADRVVIRWPLGKPLGTIKREVAQGEDVSESRQVEPE